MIFWGYNKNSQLNSEATNHGCCMFFVGGDKITFHSFLSMGFRMYHEIRIPSLTNQHLMSYFFSIKVFDRVLLLRKEQLTNAEKEKNELQT